MIALGDVVTKNICYYAFVDKKQCVSVTRKTEGH